MANNNTKARLQTALLLFLDLAGIAVAALLVAAEGFDHSRGVLALLFGGLFLVALAIAFLLPLSYAKSAGIHGLLILGSLMFMFPFAWLVTTSFKYPEEVVAYPPKWIPAVPQPEARSPFVTAELYDPAEPPEEMAAERWQRLRPCIEETLWRSSMEHISAEHRRGLDESALRPALFQALWNTLMPGMPPETWMYDDETLLAALAQRVTIGRIEDVWSSIYRCVAMRAPFVTSMERLDHEIDSPLSARIEQRVEHTDNMSLRQLPLTLSGDDMMTQVAYDFGTSPVARMRLELPLPMPASELLSVTLPLRQDRSWHRIGFALELDGQRYESSAPLFLSRYRWQELAFKLTDRDDADERDLGIWPLIPTTGGEDVYDTPGYIRITFELQRSSRLAALWNKYTRNYRDAWIAGEHWDRYIANSSYLVIMNVIGQLISCSMVAYAFARLQWPGRDILFLAVLATLMLPPQVTMIPVFMVFRSLGWYNTLKPLWVPAFAGGAFFIFLLRQFMKGIPRELEEAALIDGCGYFGIYSRIILPLIKPALAAVGIFTFMTAWNEFMGPLIYVNDQRLYPLALGLFDFRAEYGGEFGLLMAASTIMILPVVVIFFFAQKYFIQGVTLTGMKN